MRRTPTKCKFLAAVLIVGSASKLPFRRRAQAFGGLRNGPNCSRHGSFAAPDVGLKKKILFGANPEQIWRTSRKIEGVQQMKLGIDATQLAESVHVIPADLSILRPFESLTNDIQGLLNPSAEMESTLFRDMSHILLDLFIFLQPDTYMLRLAIVFGQLFGWASSLVVDKGINPSDLFFQLITFPISVFLMVRSVLPIIQALRVELNTLDMIAYKQLFEPVGVSLLQFKAMKATATLQWVQVEPLTILVDENEVLGADESNTQATDELGNPVCFSGKCPKPYVDQEGCTSCLYWLYKGDVKVSCNGRLISYIERNNGRFIDDPNSSGLLADMRFLYQMDEQIDGKESKSQSNYQNRILNLFQNPCEAIEEEANASDASADDDDENQMYGVSHITYPMTTMIIGERGGTLLQINSVKLLELMEHDDNLSDSMRRLLLKSLQRKVGHLLDSQTRTNRGGCNWEELDRDAGDIISNTPGLGDKSTTIYSTKTNGATTG